MYRIVCSVLLISAFFVLYLAQTYDIKFIVSSPKIVSFHYDKMAKYRECLPNFSTIIATENLSDQKDLLNAEMKKLFPDNSNVTFRFENNKIEESTKLVFKTSIPKTNYYSTDIGFNLIIATIAGRRAYFIDSKGEIKKEWGDDNSAFWNADYSSKHHMIALADSHNSKIMLIDSRTLEEVYTLYGYVSVAVCFDNGELYFTAERQRPGRDNGQYYRNHALYRFNLEKRTVMQLTEENLAAPRGICIYGDFIIISDTFNNQIKFLNKKTNSIEKVYDGLNMQNNVSVINKTLLVADEHNAIIREINLENDHNSYNSPFGLVLTPASCTEITEGIFKKMWLICDPDNERVIVFDKSKERYTVLINNLNCPITAVTISSDSREKAALLTESDLNNALDKFTWIDMKKN